MALTKQKLYFFLLLSTLTGYVWLAINLIKASKHNFTPCIFKNITSIPCPSCGSTRAVVSAFKGEIVKSFYWNPIGIILVIILLTVPFWLLYDTIYKKDSLYKMYFKIENIFKKPKYAALGIILVVANWIWNIYKGL